MNDSNITDQVIQDAIWKEEIEVDNFFNFFCKNDEYVASLIYEDEIKGAQYDRV